MRPDAWVMWASFTIIVWRLCGWVNLHNRIYRWKKSVTNDGGLSFISLLETAFMQLFLLRWCIAGIVTELLFLCPSLGVNFFPPYNLKESAACSLPHFPISDIAIHTGMLWDIIDPRADVMRVSANMPPPQCSNVQICRCNSRGQWVTSKILGQGVILGRDGALVESTTFNRRVVGSTPALAVT